MGEKPLARCVTCNVLGPVEMFGLTERGYRCKSHAKFSKGDKVVVVDTEPGAVLKREEGEIVKMYRDSEQGPGFFYHVKLTDELYGDTVIVVSEDILELVRKNPRNEALRWVQLWKEGKVRVWPAVYWLAAKEGVTVKDVKTKGTLWSSDGDNIQVLMKDGEIDMTRFAQSLMEFLQRSGMGPSHRGPNPPDTSELYDKQKQVLAEWKKEDVRWKELNTARWNAIKAGKGEVIEQLTALRDESTLKKRKLAAESHAITKLISEKKAPGYRGMFDNPSTKGLTIVGACCILIETTRGRVTGKMGRVVGLPDGSVLIEGNFPKVPGGTVVAVEYMDDAKARAEGEGEGGIPWRHDMESERIALERTQGGLLMRRKNKPLWEMR